MTAVLLDRAVPRPISRPTGPARPRLRVFDAAANRRRTRHRSALLILFMAVIAGFFAVAFVHAELVAGQHDLDAVRAEISQAEARHAELSRAVEQASAPAVIVERATQLGMVRAQQPVYLEAAAPVRDVQVAASLTVLVPAASADPAGAPTQPADPAVADVAAPESTGRSLQGSLGVAGGISGAAVVPTAGGAASEVALDAGTPTGTSIPTAGGNVSTGNVSTGTVSAGTVSTETGSISPVGVTGATTGTGTPTDASAVAGGSASAASSAGAASGPISSIAGTRAVTTAGATASTAAPSSPSSSSVSASSATPAGPGSGLASAAAATAAG